MKRSHIGAALGILLAAGLLVWLVFRLEDPEGLAAAFKQAMQRPLWLVAALAMFGVSLMIGTCRWVILLRSLKLPIRAPRAIQLYAVGHFFNVVVPGSTGGDVVKATCAALDCPERRPEAVASILVERVLGLVALAVLTGAVALARPGFFAGDGKLLWLRWFSIAFGGAAVAGMLVVFGWDWSRWFPDLDGSRRWHRIVETIQRLYGAARHCAAHPQALWSALVLSLFNHISLSVCFWCIGRALALSAGFVDYLTVVPIVNAVAAVPLTPGGAGLRETAMSLLLTVAGVTAADATAVSLLGYGVNLTWALVGGLCYLGLRKFKTQN